MRLKSQKGILQDPRRGSFDSYLDGAPACPRDSLRQFQITPRRVAKRFVQSFFLVIVLPAALVCGFGRLSSIYMFFAQAFALAPGIPGNFLRSAFYSYVLRDCSIDTTIAFGTFFSRSDASVGSNVSIGSYCVIGRAHIGARTQISSHVEIPSGRYQHARDDLGRLLTSVDGEVRIGEDCWIGASAIVLADVGVGTTVGAGSVVVKELPARVVAAGNPARVIRFAADTEVRH
jgi:virginiamycin A acetyltransferase